MEKYIKPTIEMFEIDVEEAILKNSKSVECTDEETMNPEDAY